MAGASADKAAPKADTSDFVKGELSSVGSDRLVTKNNRIGISAGYNRIGRVHYALVYPQIDLRFGSFRFGLGVPLNLELFNSSYPREPKTADENHIIGVANIGKLRGEDWDELSEYARPIIYVTYGNKEDHLFVNVGQRYPASLGHGTIMRRYAPNLDINVTRVSAEVDAYNDYAGFEVVTNDIFRWSMVGLIGFVKPLSILGDSSLLGKSLSVGATLVADREAPVGFEYMPEPPCPVKKADGSPACAAANVPQVSASNQLVAKRGFVTVAGIDVEAKLLKTESVDLKPFLDYSRLLVTGGGGGLTAGLLGRFNFGKSPVQALRVKLQLQSLGEGYRPAYFDTFYEVDKFLYQGTGLVPFPGSGTKALTKLEATVGDRGVKSSRIGYYLEASYGIREYIGLTFALEGEGGSSEKNFIAHVELPALSFLQLFASFYKRGFTDFGTVTSLDDKSVAFAGARLKLLPILFVNARAFKSFELDAFKGKDGPLGSLQYLNAIGYAGDVEIGYEF